ncbi:hypothetical protein HCU01_21310 [Halomonas cupida]|uniref:Uncharacterized protein n=1 Tax=Halomonas cupida TaxID=44933 RepID=A0A1M7IT89_9GAMM|nr:hypothetical protein HCU01_21310 [Halomonas cupida]SHM44034.1 hypothetical protein SAMN05660971_02975 [Halomonas cupida]
MLPGQWQEPGEAAGIVQCACHRNKEAAPAWKDCSCHIGAKHSCLGLDQGLGRLTMQGQSQQPWERKRVMEER